MRVQLKIKEMNGKPATGGFFPYAEHLPASAVAQKRRKVIPGEVFEVPTKEDAKFYLATGMIEMVL